MKTSKLLKIIAQSKSYKELKEKLTQQLPEVLTTHVVGFAPRDHQYVTSFKFNGKTYNVAFAGTGNCYLICANDKHLVIGDPISPHLFEERMFLTEFSRIEDIISGGYKY